MSVARRKRVRRRGSIQDLGSNRFRVRVRGRVPDGRPYDLDTVVTGKEAAERVLEGYRRRALDLESGLAPLEEAITLARWIERARRKHRLVWSPRDASAWKTMLRPLWNLPLQALDADRLRGWMDALERDGYAGNTRRTAWHLLRRVLGAALLARVIVRLPWGDARLSLVKGRDCAQGEALEDDDWTRVRDAARRLDARGDGGRLADLWLRLSVMRIASSRPVELCQITADDIRTGPHGALLVISPAIVAKGGKPGARTLGDVLMVAIHAHIAAMPDAAKGTGLIFPRPSTRGRWAPRWQMDAKGYKTGKHFITASELAALRAESGVPGFKPYALRHTRVTESAGSKGGFLAAQQQGGHRVAQTTQRYTHADTKHLTPDLFDHIESIVGPASAPMLPAHDDGKSVDSGWARSPGDDRRGSASDADVEDAIRYAEHVLAHGAEPTAARLIDHLGPLDSYALAGDLARVTLDPRLGGYERPLISLVAQLRAHARLAHTKPTPKIDAFANDDESMVSKVDSCFTEIHDASPDDT